MSHACCGSCDLIGCQTPYVSKALSEHERPGSTCYFSLHFSGPAYEGRRAFYQICCFFPCFYPKCSLNPFSFFQSKGRNEWMASGEHTEDLGKLMLSGSWVQRPGRSNLLSIWNIIQKFDLRLMRWNKEKKTPWTFKVGSLGRDHGPTTKAEFHLMHSMVEWQNEQFNYLYMILPR